jgi:hypothetical protein
MSATDYLPKDTLVKDNQKYVCFSIWMNDDKKTIKFIKVSGAFNTMEETQEQTQLLKEPGHFNFVLENGSWCAFDPLPNNGNLNDQLNEMMERHLLKMYSRNLEFEKRKFNMISKNLQENINTKQKELETETIELLSLTNEFEIEKKKTYI